nr:Gfo/Idh/MocA family oxidoreductase [Actinopolymorpha rutila]
MAYDHRIAPPADGGRPIGIAGAGAIVRAGHLPAYRKAGLRVAAVADLDVDAASAVAREFGVETVHDSAQALVDDPRVEVVDIAVTPHAQADIVRAAISAGKHVLCQKPFAEDLATAVELVEAAERAGTLLAVNQQMRWDQVISTTKALLQAGWYGTLTSGLFDVDVWTDWRSWPWMLAKPRLEYFYHSIHYVDAIRYVFGEPVSVVATTGRYPGQAAGGDTRTCTVYEFSSELSVTVLANHNNWSSRPRAVVRCQGTEGQSEGTLGVLYDYPVGRPDTFEFWSRTIHPDHTFRRDFEERWIPDALVGPMSDLQAAVAQGRAPLTSGRDNLGTLRVVHAACRSAEEGRRVRVDEVPLSVRSAG